MRARHARSYSRFEAALSSLTIFAMTGCAAAPHPTTTRPTPPITIARPALYPETLEVNPRNGNFLVSSVREGGVYEVARDGSVQPFVEDPRLTSVLGIAIDAKAERLYVTNSDINAGNKHSSRGPKREAGVAIYDLETRRLHAYADLAQLVPEGDHLINGLTVDPDGNAYATDSFSPAIYKVDRDGNASVFLRSADFEGPGINLNGIVYDPRGFLLAVKKSSGALYRIPLADPTHFSRVAIDATFPGGDGLLRIASDRLVIVANQTPTAATNAALVAETNDGWMSAKIVSTHPLGEVYPTTAAHHDGKVYVLSSHLDEWLTATDATRNEIAARGRVGEVRTLDLDR